ncbi:12486_t:CDS:2, partial [Funneliformis geosporum]
IMEVWQALKAKLKNSGTVQVYRHFATPRKVSADTARTTYNLSNNQVVIAENKLDRAERKLDKVRGLVANGELEKLKADDVSEIKLSANETIFNQKKQALITKIKSLNTKCQTSDSYSIATNQLSEVEKLEPKHQKELLQLEKEAQELQSAYDENVKKANDTNTSVADKNKFLLLADEVAKKAKNLKSKIKTNPLADLSRFSNLDDLEVLLKGNIPKKPPSSSGNPRNTNPSNGGENSNSNNSQQL